MPKLYSHSEVLSYNKGYADGFKAASAAAPALLEALERLVARLDAHYGGDPTQDWQEQSMARAAIAQAKGNA